MITKTIFPIFFSFLSLYAGAQPVVRCTGVQNQDNSFSIFSESQFYGICTVKITFSSLEGYSTSSPVTLINNEILASVDYGKQEIVKLSRNKSAPAHSFRYNYSYFPGKAMDKAPDSSFPYLLPANVNNSVRISRVSSIQERLGQKTPDGYSGIGFVYKLGDTICAARTGIVYECIDTVQQGEKTSDFYKQGRNKIKIQHRDGSIGIYDILAPIHLLVQAGDAVFPGTPLAVFNKESEKYTLLLFALYLNKNKVIAHQPSSNDKAAPSCFDYIHMHFYTGANPLADLELQQHYLTQHPKEIIAAEMTRREKKKFGF